MAGIHQKLVNFITEHHHSAWIKPVPGDGRKIAAVEILVTDYGTVERTVILEPTWVSVLGWLGY